MRILSVGGFEGKSNTCLHRNWALHSIADSVDEVNTAKNPWSFWCRVCFYLFQKGFPIRIPENAGENSVIKQLVSRNHYDIVWIDKGQTILPETLKFVKSNSPSTILISYSPDNMAKRHNQTQQYIESLPYYDLIVTNKSYIVDPMRNIGAKRVIFENNCFEPTFHYPRSLSKQDILDLGGEVGFVGAWEEARCQSVCYLADHGIKVRVFGDGRWQDYRNYNPNLKIETKVLKGEDYCKSVQAFKISLCFLRKMNEDRQTTRTVEIPACGGFMLAERTDEHLAMFSENREAAYFETNKELLEKCSYYLTHEEERVKIAEMGHLRCLESGYDNISMIRRVIEKSQNTQYVD